MALMNASASNQGRTSKLKHAQPERSRRRSHCSLDLITNIGTNHPILVSLVQTAAQFPASTAQSTQNPMYSADGSSLTCM